MAITNLNNIHLTEEEVNAAKDAMTTLENKLAVINVNLTAKDRQKYGSINEQNKLVVNKVNDYHINQPELQNPKIDWHEFEKDYASRSIIENLIARLESMTVKLTNAKTLHDYDNYQAALSDYAYTSYMAGSEAAGYETKMNDIKHFFGKNTVKATDTPNP